MAVNSRKFVWIFLLLSLLALVFSPGTNAPSPAAVMAPLPEEEADSAEPLPDVRHEPSKLQIAIFANEANFDWLRKQNERLMQYRPDLDVTLERIDLQDAGRMLRKAFELEQAPDVLMLPNEWVKPFATSGFLLPADAAFTGQSLSDEFEALASAVKWNGMMWGVPSGFDPYVIVWNKALLQQRLGKTDPFPLSYADWETLSNLYPNKQPMAAIDWLAIDASDPLALLTWLSAATGERTDGLWETGSSPWESGALADGLSLLDRAKGRVLFAGTNDIAASVQRGETIAAVLPYSLATGLASSSAGLILDRSSWKLPYVWPRASSFVISANTLEPEAAREWIAGMTTPLQQSDNWKERRTLPVYRSIYDSEGSLRTVLSTGDKRSFPNVVPLNVEPELPEQLEKLGELWSGLASGQLTFSDWQAKWRQNAKL
jgi:ABC-type glycerol-3-phosphate transport system substrate-binding protein